MDDNEIRSILSPYPKAVSLYDNVVKSYGDSLSFAQQRPDSPTSETDMRWDDNGKLSAQVKIATGSQRVAGAISHELLHLSLPIRGFPIKSHIVPPNERVAVFNASVDKILNVVAHEIIFSEFKELGLPTEHFLGKGDDLDLATAKNELVERRRRGALTDHCRALKTADYFAYWITNRHRDFQYPTKEYLEMLIRFWPSVRVTAQELHEWFNLGCFQSADDCDLDFHRLFHLLGFPSVEFKRLPEKFNSKHGFE